MHVWQIASFGIDSLELVERPDLQPGPGEVLVRIRAVSLNYRDLMVVTGRYNPKMHLPRVPCSDGAGEIMAVGPGVSGWKLGDRVAGIFMQNWLDGSPTRDRVKGALGGDIDGTLAEHIVLKATGLVAIPSHLSFEEGGYAALRGRYRMECSGVGEPQAGGKRVDPGNRRSVNLRSAVRAHDGGPRSRHLRQR